MKAADLENHGFAKNSADGLFYAADSTGEVTRVGRRTVSFEGEEQGVEIMIDADNQRAVVREWSTRLHPHPDGDPEYTLDQFLASEVTAMLQSPFTMKCGFCGKSDTEVARLIAGPQSMICNECVALCQEILTA